MKKLLLILCLSALAFALEVPKNHIVSTSWLAKNIDNKDLVIIDTRKNDTYKKNHITKAISYPKKMWFQGIIGKTPKLYNTPQQFEEMFQDAGVTQDSMVVFYSAGSQNKDFADAASAFYTAWIYGFKNIAILNGGYAKWSEEKKVVSEDTPKINASDFEVETFEAQNIASLNEVIAAQYDDDIQLADTRVAAFYTGEKGRKDLARKGRITSAKLTPMIRQSKKVNNHYEFLSKKEASKTLYNAGFGIELDKEAIYYCNTAHKARGLWFVSKFIIGMEKVKVYDASMVEYTKTLLPMETGESMD
jgi:thiosulfate/3-mercaptopyruvate sulfurtransferase